VVAYKRRSEIRDWLVEHRRHPLVRPLFAVGRPLYRWLVQPVARLLAPYVRFVGQRVMPGELGLELTTLMAVGGVGMFFFVLYLTELDRSLAPTPFDSEILDLVDTVRMDMLVDIAKVVTDLGAFPTVAGLVTATTVLLVVRRRYSEAIVLVVGLALLYIAVHVTKEAIDRPRPTDPLAGASGDAYPSGHAAYGTAWVAAAVVLMRRLRLVTGGSLIFIAIGIAAVVGVSRAYLRVHWWSDIAGGWGLGAGIFALLGAIALVVEYIRNNGRMRGAETSEAATARQT
jgi:membrane-associated phospholipid phosphatase